MSNVIQFRNAGVEMVLAEMRNPAGSSNGRDALNDRARSELIKLGEMLTAKVAMRKAQQVTEAN